MALTKISSQHIAAGAITSEQLAANSISAEKLQSGVGGGPKIANVQIANSSWSVLDDTAVDTAGGYLIVNGSGFISGCDVLLDTSSASAVTFVSSTQLRVTAQAKSAATYNVYVVNPDGGTAIKVNALTYSAAPAWVTSSALADATTNTAYSYQLTATDATSYSLQAGSTLPANSTLASNGLFSGNTNVASNTAYSFTVVATDAQNQDSPRTFSLNINAIVPDPYYANVSLLLNFNGSNNSTSFSDSSTNNLTVSRTGSGVIVTNVKKYGTGSYYNPGAYSGLYVNDHPGLNFGSNNFTIEAWVYLNSSQNFPYGQVVWKHGSFYLVLNQDYGVFGTIWKAGGGSIEIYGGGSFSGPPPSLNTWHHVALVRNGTNFSVYLNGVQKSSDSSSDAVNSTSNTLYIGVHGNPSFQQYAIDAYIDDLRITKGTARYTTNFTPPTLEFANTA